jgi:murein DD-endopeptidase MepM/ murein hydrolase activator NlpD
MRAALLALLFATTPTTLTSSASPPSLERPDPTAVTRTMLELADAFGMTGLRAEMLDPALRLQRRLRDAVEATKDNLAAIAEVLDEQPGVRIPDLTVLTHDPVKSITTSGFGWREDPIRNHGKFHNGADLRGTHGTPVHAAGDGVVIFCGDKAGYGNVIFVDHGGGVVTRYAHLRRLETKTNATVVAGQRIGQVGSTGRSTGPHLHFEVRLDGNAVDPITALAVAELSRVSPVEGRIAAYALSPDLQAQKLSDIDPPKSPRRAAKKPQRVKRIKPNV